MVGIQTSSSPFGCFSFLKIVGGKDRSHSMNEIEFPEDGVVIDKLK